MDPNTKRAWLTELLKLSHWFRTNAAIVHGHPARPQETSLEERTTCATEIASAAASSLGMAGKLARLALAAALLFGSAGGGALVATWLTRAPAAAQSAGSLLQFLEDRGLHNPPEETPGK